MKRPSDPTKSSVHFHSRCIPYSQLVPGHPISETIINNGLCDTFTDETLSALRDLGVSVVEARAVWAMLEPEKNQWNWSYLELCLEACRRNGIKLGLFCWPQHAPEWFLEETGIPRMRCLEHDSDSRFLSIWSPQTIEAYSRFYAAMAARFSSEVALVYVGSSGCFGEPQYPQGVTHYKFFSDTHNHAGFWCGDSLAREDYERACGRVMPVNAQELQTLRTSPPAWVEFSRWYTRSLASFVDSVCHVAAAAFPNIRRVMPIGTRGEPLSTGQDKWQMVEVASRHGMSCRWTGCGHYEDFAETNIDARRISSACRITGCGFGTESALYISEANSLNCIYEQLANGASIVHDDPGNYLRNRSAFERNIGFFTGRQPRTRIACFYSKLQQWFNDRGCPTFDGGADGGKDVRVQYFSGDFCDKFWFQQAVHLRSRCDFEILDADMISVGALQNFDLLVSFGGWVDDDPSLAREMASWIKQGGKLIEWTEDQTSTYREGFRTIAQMCGVGPVSSFDEEVLSALQHVQIVPSLSWADISSDSERCYVTAFDDGLLCFNAGDSNCRVRIGSTQKDLTSRELWMLEL